MAVRKTNYNYPTTVGRTRFQFGEDARTNILSLIDSLIMLAPGNNANANGWAFSKVNGSGTDESPQYHIWTNQETTAQKIRATYTRSGNYVTQIVWEWTEDNGSTPNATGTWTSHRTFTASYSSTHLSGGNNSSIFAWFFELLGKFLDLRTSYNAHAASGSAHGMGTMATQSAAAVAITGGSIDAISLGLTTPAHGRFWRAVETANTYAPGSGAAASWDWGYGGSVMTNNGVNSVSFTNMPASGSIGTHYFHVTNFNNTTFPASVNWGVGGKPSIAGAARGVLVTTDGGTVVAGSVTWRAV